MTERRNKKSGPETNGNGGKKMAAESTQARPKQGRPARTVVEPRQMIAIGLLMEGKTQKAVGEELGVDEKTISRWLREPAVKLEFGQQLAASSAEMWAQMIAQRAEVWATFRKLLQSQDERIALRAATWYLSRVMSLTSMEDLLEGETRALRPLPRSFLALFEEGPSEGSGEES